jgi:release factor glutamine methyltransferase
MPTVQAALATGCAALTPTSASPRLDAELLLGHALGRDRAWLYANPDATCSPDARTVYRALLSQRAAGQPVAQLVGSKEFWSLAFVVNGFTLTPRPETEGLVEQALLRLADPDSAAQVLELGTGSGAIAVALATERPALQLLATDSSPEALAVARQNAARHAPGRIELRAGDWYGALAAGERFAMIISNPPYIGVAEAARTDPELQFEPAQALYSGPDGLRALRLIIAGAPRWLHPGGWLLLEHGYNQASAVAALLQAAGFSELSQHTDLAGHPRISCARLAPN